MNFQFGKALREKLVGDSRRIFPENLRSFGCDDQYIHIPTIPQKFVF